MLCQVTGIFSSEPSRSFQIAYDRWNPQNLTMQSGFRKDLPLKKESVPYPGRGHSGCRRNQNGRSPAVRSTGFIAGSEKSGGKQGAGTYGSGYSIRRAEPSRTWTVWSYPLYQVIIPGTGAINNLYMHSFKCSGNFNSGHVAQYLKTICKAGLAKKYFPDQQRISDIMMLLSLINSTHPKSWQYLENLKQTVRSKAEGKS